MIICPTCRSTYTDKSLSFCLQDGTKLIVVTDDMTQMETIALEKPAVLRSYDLDDDPINVKKSSLINKILLPVLLLIIGIGIHYTWIHFIFPPKTSIEPARLLQARTVDSKLTSFEELRRQVDSDPVKFISANAATSDYGEDYYLLGRAYLLTGDYVKARNAFMEARNRLQEINEINRKPIMYETAMGMAILNNMFTQRALADDLSSLGLSSTSKGPGTNSNSNR
jgi:tetratricopeptide (TPR) repeat protein